jgi:putative FmdB family regulatory protein
MPTYEYICRACGHNFEIYQAFTDDTLTICPSCGGELRKVFGAPTITFKGSGFYATDNRKGAKSGGEKSGGEKKAEGSEEPSSGDKGSSKDGSSGSKESSGSSESSESKSESSASKSAEKRSESSKKEAPKP